MINFPKNDDGKWDEGEMWDENGKKGETERWAHSKKWVKRSWDYDGRQGGGGQKLTAVKMGVMVERVVVV